jgi:hypothetical protein
MLSSAFRARGCQAYENMIRHYDRGAGRTKGSNLRPVCAATSSSVYPAARPEACLTGTLVTIGMRTGTEGPLTLRWREADELAGRTRVKRPVGRWRKPVASISCVSCFASARAESRINSIDRDRGRLAVPPLPHHRAYGSRTTAVRPG